MADFPDPVFEDMGEIHVTGVRVSVRPGGQADIPKAWTELHARAGEITGADVSVALGVMLPMTGGGNSGAADSAAAARGFDYLAGVPLTGGGASAPPPGMARVTLAPRRYAVFTHVIKSPDLGRELPPVFQYIYRTWLPASGLRMADAPDFERYDGRFDPKTLSGEIGICVPVENG